MKAAQYALLSLSILIGFAKWMPREASSTSAGDGNIARLYPTLKQNLYRFQVCLLVFAGRVSLHQYLDFFVSLESEIPDLEGASKSEIFSEVGLILEGAHKRLMGTIEGSKLNLHSRFSTDLKNAP